MNAKHLVALLLDGLPPSLRLMVTFRMFDDSTVDLPALVTREVRVDEDGAYRITLFNKQTQWNPLSPIGHVNFDHEGPLTPDSVMRALSAHDYVAWSELLGVYNAQYGADAVDMKFRAG